MPWFSEAGGSEPLAKRMIGLDSLLDNCEGKTVLDLGGAEGLISQQFVERGAHSAVVVDFGKYRAGYVAATGRNDGFIPYDLNDVRAGSTVRGEPFDIVLALAVAQKLKDPEGFLLWAAGRGKTLAVRLPSETFHRKRDPSGPTYSAVDILAPVATLVDDPPSFEGSWLGIFEVNE